MSSESASRPPEVRLPPPAPAAGLLPWPRSLFGRLFAAVLAGVLAAQAISVVLVTREREREYIRASVREWSRRLADHTMALAPLPPQSQLQSSWQAGPDPASWPPDPAAFGLRPGPAGVRSQIIASPVQLPDFGQDLQRHLQEVLGPAYRVQVLRTVRPAPPAIALVRHGPEAFERGGHSFDVLIAPPAGEALRFRIAQGERGAPLPRSLIMNLVLAAIASGIVLYLATRTITRPLSRLAHAAEAMGRDLSPPPLPEQGVTELREAARAFNAMQERLRRYVGSRTAVLAAMSHDLKTPLTRMRLRSATLADPALSARFDADLAEMESMVRGALAMLRGLNDEEPVAELDVNALLATLQDEFAELGERFEVQGRALRPYLGRPQALKRCLTNLLSNAVKFGGGVRVTIEDGAQLTIRVLDSGPGIPAAQLEKVFEPFYRLESSRNRDTGGTGLGLCIARDIAQAHGGQLQLVNRVPRGLAAVLSLPRPAR